MKKNKRLKLFFALSVIITMMFAGVALAIPSFNDKTPTTRAVITGEGIESDPYMIYDIADLNSSTIRNAAGTSNPKGGPNYFRLANSINFGASAWTPIPLLASGNVFDGDGHELIGMSFSGTTTDFGFFANLRGTIKNVTFRNVNINGGISVGTVAARVDGAAAFPNGAKIEKVFIESGTVQANGNQGANAGGFVGLVSSGHLMVEKCYTRANISTIGNNRGRTGGVVAYVDGANSRVTISYVYNQGNITNSATGGPTNENGAGGIVGQLSASASAANVNITNSANIGTVTGSNMYGIGPANTFDGTCESGTPTVNNKVLEIEMVIFDIKIYEITRPNPATSTEPNSFDFSTDQASDNVRQGESYTFRITLVTGFELSSISVTPTDLLDPLGMNGTQFSTTPISTAVVGGRTQLTYKIDNVFQSVKITVTTAQIKHMVTVPEPAPGANYTINHAESGLVNHGGSFEVKITPATGYEIASVIAGGQSVPFSREESGVRIHTISNITAPVTVTAVNTQLKSYLVTRVNAATGLLANSGTGWIVTGIPSHGVSAQVEHGFSSNYNFTITLDEGYRQNTPTVIIGGVPYSQAHNPLGVYNYSITITASTTISIGATINTYTVALPTTVSGEFGYSAAPTSTTSTHLGLNDGKAEHGFTYSFTLTMEEGCDQVSPTVTLLDTATPTPNTIGTLTGSKAGNVYTFTFTANQHTNMTVAIVENTYSVTPPETPRTGYDYAFVGASPNLIGDNIEHGGSFTFSITVQAAYSQSTPTVTYDIVGGASGNSANLDDKVGNKYTYTISGITKPIEIKVTGTSSMNDYTVNPPIETEIDFDIVNGFSTAVKYGGSFRFTVDLKAAYTQETISVYYYEAATATGPKKSATFQSGEYVINSIVTNITIVVEGTGASGAIKKNTYSITRPSTGLSGTGYQFQLNGGYTTSLEIQHGAEYGFQVGYDVTNDDGYITEYIIYVNSDVYRLTKVQLQTQPLGYFEHIINEVTGDITISITVITQDTFSVAPPSGPGFTFTPLNGASASTAGRGDTYEFTVTTEFHPDYSDAVINVWYSTDGGNNWTQITLISDKYTIANVQTDIMIKVDPLKRNTYSLSVPAPTPSTDGYTYTQVAVSPSLEDGRIPYDGSYTFRVTIEASHSNSPLYINVYVNGLLVDTFNTGGEYTINNIKGNVRITVGSTDKNTLVDAPIALVKNDYSVTGPTQPHVAYLYTPVTQVTTYYGDEFRFTLALKTPYSQEGFNVTRRSSAPKCSRTT